jgi:uncharacterized protein YegL
VGFGGPPPLRYRLQPQAPGRWPTNVEAVALYLDGTGHRGQARFPVPEVEVYVATPSATPTVEPTPTPGPSPSPRPASPTPSRTPGPTPVPLPVVLPIVLNEHCVPEVLALDAALVLDTSSSMEGEKLSAAVAAARSFLDVLSLGRDRVALVTFDSHALLAQPLTAERAELDAALDAVATAPGTRIDLGLTLALAELGGARGRREAERLLILVTDGRPDGDSQGATYEAARLARELRINIYAIGLGADVIPEVLAEVAGDPARVYLAPTAADIGAIYHEIARVIPCR